MHGIPADLPLRSFVGLEINMVGLGRFQTQFHCAGAGSIFVEGRWELRDAAGSVIDCQQDHDSRAAYRIHEILDVPIVRYEVDPPRSFTIVFENDLRLSVFDDSPQYESFSIHLDGQPSMYV
jgi:hypothetical protein